MLAESRAVALDCAERHHRADRWPVDTHHRHRWRPASSALRPILLRTRHGEEHLRHRLLPADDDREQTARFASPIAHNGRVAEGDHPIRAGRQRLRRWRRRAMAEGWPRLLRTIRGYRS